MRRIKIRRDTHGGTKYISASGWPEEMQEFHEIEEQYLFPIVARIVTHLSKPFILFSTTTHFESRNLFTGEAKLHRMTMINGCGRVSWFFFTRTCDSWVNKNWYNAYCLIIFWNSCTYMRGQLSITGWVTSTRTERWASYFIREKFLIDLQPWTK